MPTISWFKRRWVTPNSSPTISLLVGASAVEGGWHLPTPPPAMSFELVTMNYDTHYSSKVVKFTWNVKREGRYSVSRQGLVRTIPDILQDERNWPGISRNGCYREGRIKLHKCVRPDGKRPETFDLDRSGKKPESSVGKGLQITQMFNNRNFRSKE